MAARTTVLFIACLMLATHVAPTFALAHLDDTQQRPNFSGSWVRRGPAVDEKTAPPLTPEGQRQYDINKVGIAASDPEVDLILKCLPAGFPRSILSGQPFYIAQTPEAIIWVGGS